VTVFTLGAMMGAAVIVSIMKFILKGEVTVDCLIAGLVTAAGSLSECAVQRRCLSAGANPARPLSHRPEATGAVMGETKWLKPLV
jgi:hypothetical protein